jgi:hypothetical protein
MSVITPTIPRRKPVLFVPKYKTYDDALSALEVAKFLYEEADREYREYYDAVGDCGDRHQKFLFKEVRRTYRNLERVLEGIRRSGYSQIATTHLLLA